MGLTHILQILLLAIVQGLAELLPISSSAHVTVVARLIGYDLGSATTPTAADVRWIFLLIMLHTGTMFAVLFYFRRRWKPLLKQIPALVVATGVTGVVGIGLMKLIEHVTHQSIEHLSRNLLLVGPSLAAAGILILLAGRADSAAPASGETIGIRASGIIGFVQGLALPLSRFLAVGLDHFDGHVVEDRPCPSRGIQLRAGGAAHSAVDRLRGGEAGA